MAEGFQFSPRPNRAHEIAWRSWDPDSFAVAQRTGRPIFLNLTVQWCHWCHMMDETTFSDPSIIALLNERVVPIRVDADRFPHVQDRYIAGGWPTNAFLTPTGELLWSGTYVDAAALAAMANDVLGAWESRRDELDLEIERRRRALEAARARQRTGGLVRRSAADDVLTILRESFDERNGGFDAEPKFPHAAAIELLYLRAQRGDEDCVALADRTLDGMIAGELFDHVEGGFYRYALAADWTEPRREKLLETNAALLRSYALGAHLRGREDWADIARRIVAWVDAALSLPNGLVAASLSADEAYFQAPASARESMARPPADPAIYTHWNAQWIAALADAGSRLGDAEWSARSATLLATLLETMRAPAGRMHHFQLADSAPENATLLADTLYTAIACLAVAQATGDAAALDQARAFAVTLERDFWSDDGGFFDRAKDGDEFGLLRYRDRPLEPNVDAARFLLDLALVTGERGHRACAERTLALLSGGAGRYGAAAAGFATAVDEFFYPPLRIFVVGDHAAARPLRAAALALARVDRRVFPAVNGTRIGPLHLESNAPAAAFLCDQASCSTPIVDPGMLHRAAASA